jgi:ectoine hydroxylase-related dioxygenase (phytanoyl-CoA dioxygenase family)
MVLTVEQIRFFHLNGFLSITEPIASQEELAWMRESYDRMFSARAGRESGDQFDLAGTDEDGKEASLPQILSPTKYAPELERGEYLVKANQIVQDLLGPEASVGVAHAIFKPAGSGAATPWHQDEAYWDPELQYKSVSVWMPLQPATLENGCLWFMPRSHEWEILPHRSIGGDVRIHGLEVVDSSVFRDPVPCPLPPGGITIHLNRTAHYAGANTSDIPRRALILGGGLPAHPYPVQRHFPWNEMKQTAREDRAVAART